MMLLAVLLSFAMSTELGPDIGETVPQAERFEAFMGENGATVVFVRSVDWCPYCKKQVMELDDAAAKFTNEGRPLIFVSYDSEATQATFAKRQEVEAAFISDEGSSMIKAFGILNENHQPGSRVYGIPHPAVFVIDRDGVVRAKLYEGDWATNDKSYRNRPAVETIFEAVQDAR